MITDIQSGFIQRVIENPTYMDAYLFRENEDDFRSSFDGLVSDLREYVESDMPEDDGIVASWVDRLQFEGGELSYEEHRDALIELMKRLFRLDRYEVASVETEGDLEDDFSEFDELDSGDFELDDTLDLDAFDEEEDDILDHYRFPEYDSKFFEKVGMSRIPILYEGKEFQSENKDKWKGIYESILKNKHFRKALLNKEMDEATARESLRLIMNLDEEIPGVKSIQESLKNCKDSDMNTYLQGEIKSSIGNLFDRARNGLYTYYKMYQ